MVNKPKLLSKDDAKLIIKLNDEAQTLLDKDDKKSDARLDEITNQIDDLCDRLKLTDHYRYNVLELVKIAKKVLSKKNFSDSVTDPQPKNPGTPTTPAETTCPDCGKKIIAEFNNLTDEEFSEIVNEAKEYSKYPEQFQTEGDRIQAFTSWLQNSRFKDFCNEALYKAFCGVK